MSSSLFFLVLLSAACCLLLMTSSSCVLCDIISRKKDKTFKPKKNIPEGTKQYHLKKYAEATLGSGNLRLAVTLPEGEDLNEWLAVNSKNTHSPSCLLVLFWFRLHSQPTQTTWLLFLLFVVDCWIGWLVVELKGI